MLTPEDHQRIEAAVAKAEAGTSGDIVCVLAGEVSSYREVPLAWGATVALIVPPLVMGFAFKPLVDAITAGGWTAAQVTSAQAQMVVAFSGYVVAQILLFAITTIVVSLPPVRRRLTPRFLKRHRVKKAAFHHFAAAHAHAEDSDTGIVIFVALEERQVEVLADQAIHAKAGEAPWQEAAAAVGEGMKSPDPTSGIVRAIEICGAALKTYFPSTKPRTATDRPIDD